MYEVVKVDAYGGWHRAVQIPWEKVYRILGRDHNGTPGDNGTLIAHLRSADAPTWIESAEGWTDEYGWGLIGPEEGVPIDRTHNPGA